MTETLQVKFNDLERASGRHGSRLDERKRKNYQIKWRVKAANKSEREDALRSVLCVNQHACTRKSESQWRCQRWCVFEEG